MKLSEKQLRWLQKIYKVYCCTLRFNSINQDVPDNLLKKNISFLGAFWHDEIIAIPPSRACYSVPIKPVALTSPSRDGTLVEYICSAYDIDVIRGSSSNKGFEAIRAIKKRVNEGQNNIISIAVDGPRGPSRKVKPGIIYLASLLQLPIITMRYLASPVSIIYKAWDCQKVPFPFAKIHILYGEPIYVPKKISSEGMEEYRLQVEERLCDLSGLRKKREK